MSKNLHAQSVKCTFSHYPLYKETITGFLCVHQSHFTFTFLVLLLGDHSHGHTGWRGEFPSTRQAADLQWTEIALQGVFQSHISLLTLFLLLWALPRPVVDLESHHFTARTWRAKKENRSGTNFFTIKAHLTVRKRKWDVVLLFIILLVCVVVPSSRKGGGHGGRLWRGAPDLFPIRTSRWGCWGGQNACVASHRIIWVHWKL